MTGLTLRRAKHLPGTGRGRNIQASQPALEVENSPSALPAPSLKALKLYFGGFALTHRSRASSPSSFNRASAATAVASLTESSFSVCNMVL